MEKARKKRLGSRLKRKREKEEMGDSKTEREREKCGNTCRENGRREKWRKGRVFIEFRSPQITCSKRNSVVESGETPPENFQVTLPHSLRWLVPRTLQPFMTWPPARDPSHLLVHNGHATAFCSPVYYYFLGIKKWGSSPGDHR